MEILQTSRLMWVPTPLHVLKKRLEQDSFTEVVAVADESVAVEFPSEWPAGALVLFPRMIDALEANPNFNIWDGTVVERETATAIGQMGFKGLPDEEGRVEIGYNINTSSQGRGYATEMVKALVAWVAEQAQVKQIAAECLETNAGSVRVLEKVGFERVGKRSDEEGSLILWQYPL